MFDAGQPERRAFGCAVARWKEKSRFSGEKIDGDGDVFDVLIGRAIVEAWQINSPENHSKV